MLSNFAFNFNLRCYKADVHLARALALSADLGPADQARVWIQSASAHHLASQVGQCRLTLSIPR